MQRTSSPFTGRA